MRTNNPQRTLAKATGHQQGANSPPSGPQPATNKPDEQITNTSVGAGQKAVGGCL